MDLLADKYGTDKGGMNLVQRSGKCNPPHTFTDYYEQLFYGKELEVRHVLEIGIGTDNLDITSNMGPLAKPGASLRMWRDFFPNAIIYGADIDPNVLFSEERIKTYKLDQTNVDDIKEFYSNLQDIKFDLIVDDGLHRFNAGTTLFLNSITQLSNTGTYVIEDVTHDNLIKYESFFSDYNYNVKFIKFYGHIKKGYDSNHNLIEIKLN